MNGVALLLCLHCVVDACLRPDTMGDKVRAKRH
jgi:hypothetical protein